ncbi:MAG: hypothetical protein M1484_03510 [Patescibacteria group bacterium]|nr:hypothetical protein [Patescibacteria group bacterium]MCL5432130.1 hypothetical protein [Patescibacteria group bacterium]
MVPIGLTLVISFLVFTFLVWNQARTRGLAQEQVLDTLLLATMLGLIAARAGYIYLHWGIFSNDLSRLILVVKYPGWELLPFVAAAGIATILASISFGLDWLLMLDIFGLASFPVLALGFLGTQNYSLSAVAALLTVLMFFLARQLRHNVFLADFSRRYGLFILGYLIFQLSSLLMWLPAAVILIILIARYWRLFKLLLYAIPKRSFKTN